jgi:catechol 2,3-dioxygenase
MLSTSFPSSLPGLTGLDPAIHERLSKAGTPHGCAGQARARRAKNIIPKINEVDMSASEQIAGSRETPEPRPIDPGVRIGHVHLKVADLERALRFYCGVLGFELTQRRGAEAAFVSAGGYHHHIGLNTWESFRGSPPPSGTTGLYHLAILYPTRAALADALSRLIAAGIPLDGASDHGVSEALYLRDPDQNGVELYCDRPQQLWPRTADGTLAMVTRRLDLDDLLHQAPAKPRPRDRACGEMRDP